MARRPGNKNTRNSDAAIPATNGTLRTVEPILPDPLTSASPLLSPAADQCSELPENPVLREQRHQ